MRHLARALVVGGARFFEHSCTQMAAAFSYHVLFSLFPFAILFVSIVGLVLQDDTRRDAAVDWLLQELPLSGSAGADLAAAVDGVATPTSAIGLVAIVGVLWSATGMISTVRVTLARIWGTGTRSFVRSKALDVVLVLVTALAVLAAFALTVLAQALGGAASEVAAWMGLPSGTIPSGRVLQFGTGWVVAFGMLLLVYRVVPPAEVRLRDVWPAALLASLALDVATTGYGIYLERFSDINLVYGSLGAVIGFLLLVYVAAFVLFMGAEVAAAWPETRQRLPKAESPSSVVGRARASVQELLEQARTPAGRG